MIFREYLNNINDIQDFEMVVGDVYMPATISWDDEIVITNYFEQKYGKILDSEVSISKTNYDLDVVEILDDTIDEHYGLRFVSDMIGECSVSEYNRLCGI